MSDNKFVKAAMDGVVLTAIITGIGWAVKRVLKVNFISDPSSSLTSFFEFAAVTTGSVALKTYLIDQKIIPSNV